MAVFSLIVLLGLLAGAALFSVQPWEDDSVAPQVGISPGLGIALGDGVVVAPAERSRVAAAGAADVGRSVVVAAEQGAAGEHALVATIGISPSRPVQVSSASAPSPAPLPKSPPPPLAQPLPVPEAPIVVAIAPPPPSESPLVANFEEGLKGWSASVGDVFPGIVGGIVRDGSKASVVRVTGNQTGSHLILGDAEGAPVQIEDGDSLVFAFSFYVGSMTYGRPGADNLIMRFESDATESRAFGLQLWDPEVSSEAGGRGLWASGEAMGGDRFLAAVPERVWHDVVVSFVASSQGLGSYELYLDGQLVDARAGVSIIAPGSSYAQIGVGLLRDGDLVQGTSEIRIDAAKLGSSLEPVQP